MNVREMKIFSLYCSACFLYAIRACIVSVVFFFNNVAILKVGDIMQTIKCELCGKDELAFSLVNNVLSVENINSLTFTFLHPPNLIYLF